MSIGVTVFHNMLEQYSILYQGPFDKFVDH